MKVRQPIAIGFYPASKKTLIETIEECFNSSLGPRGAKIEKRRKSFGFVTPHAGYVYSGPAAAWVYKIISTQEDIDTAIIFGTSHEGYRGFFLDSFSHWKTPLGEIEVNNELREEIVGEVEVAKVSNNPHLYEHSIEVQLPFLQYVNPEVKIVPVIVSETSYPKIKKFAESLADVLKDEVKEIAVIASSDFTHYGVMYGYCPAGTENVESILEWIKENDMKLINIIRNLDGEKLLTTVMETGTTMCGYSPVSALLNLAEKLNYKEVKLLKYYTSYEISRNPEAIVGYAAIEIS